MKKLSLYLIAGALAACGGDKHEAPAPVVVAPQPPQASADPFVASVNTVVGASSDTSEPQAIESATPTAPEDAEPVAVTP
jgi:hypothetical protein